MSSQINSLEKLGLSKKEARLYLISLETGPATVAKLAQKSGLKRGTIYEFLGEMVEKGLLEVSISGKRKLYSGTEPKKLQKIIDRQKDILESLLPDLSLLTSTGPNKPKIKFYEGKEGILKAYYEILDLPDGSEVIGFATLGEIYKIFTRSDVDKYVKKRAAKRIKEKLIMPTDEYSESHSQDNKKEWRETLLIPRSKFFITNEINVYQNKVAIVSLGEEKVAVIIESQQIADTQRAIFNLIWNNLRKK
ncbi:MAG: Transcriptional regulator, TrmB [uncultured bacterium]|nr:MAG: Transcriptional regulator, TrmB [uncultured bacterium]KKQ45196.1 MAG: Transcriptional regulator, TrmB [Candidatus Moranbacteria bacterium GW2011_GWC2_37_8]KKQ60962.1 MAG: Transcriptional regulator, TrmB [Parcubacteria group bacterium GW2011_GWC1_38_22]